MLSSEIRFVFELGVLIVFTRMGGYWLRRWLRLQHLRKTGAIHAG